MDEQPKTAMEAPADFESLRSAIIERRRRLPKRLAQVAAYALENPDEIAFGTASSIATAADVQPSTLVRLAHQFGYDGFSHLQRIFRERLRELNLSYNDRLARLEKTVEMTAESALFRGFIESARSSLAAMEMSVREEHFQKAVDILAKAETIYLIAKRRSYPLTAHMAYSFSKLGIRHQIVASPNGLDVETIRFAEAKDAVIAISFSPYAADSLEHARTLHLAGVPVIAITDSAFSPLVECSTSWLEVAETDFAGFRSLSASFALTIALSVAIAEHRRRNVHSELT